MMRWGMEETQSAAQSTTQRELTLQQGLMGRDRLGEGQGEETTIYYTKLYINPHINSLLNVIEREGEREG